MRKEQEDLVLAADNPKGMRTTILRPPDFYGPDSELSYVRAIFDAALKGGTANVIGPIDTPHEFIFSHAAPVGIIQPASPRSRGNALSVDQSRKT